MRVVGAGARGIRERLGMSYLLYEFVLSKLSIGAWDELLEEIFRWPCVLMLGACYAWNPVHLNGAKRKY